MLTWGCNVAIFCHVKAESDKIRGKCEVQAPGRGKQQINLEAGTDRSRTEVSHGDDGRRWGWTGPAKPAPHMISRVRVLRGKRKLKEEEGMFKQKNYKINFLSEKLALTAGWPSLGQDSKTFGRRSLTCWRWWYFGLGDHCGGRRARGRFHAAPLHHGSFF